MDELLKQISQNPDSIDAFTADQVTEAQDALKAFMAQVKAKEIPAGTAELAEVKALTDRLGARAEAIATEQAEFDAQVAELEKSLGMVEDQEPDPEDDDDDDEAKVVEVEAVVGEETEEEVEVTEEPVPVTAAARPALANLKVPKAQKPAEEPAALVASAGGFQGERVTTQQRLAELFIDRANKLGNERPAQGRSQHSVAQFKYDSGVVVKDGHNPHEVGAAFDEATRQSKQLDSLTAALAFCAPAQPIYEQFGNISRDGLIALPTVTAPRGQVIYPDSISYPVLRNEPAIGAEWDGEGNKQVYTFDCPETTTCSVVANTIILEFNNATARFYPEAVADLNAKALATAAQAVNARHIADIVANTKVEDYGADNGGGGGIVNLASNLAFHLSYYREKFRLSKGAVLDVIFPHWVFDALWADAYARDSTTEYGGVRARVSGMLADLNIRAQFVYGWQGTYDVGVAAFPETVDVLFWEPGTVVRLDSGTLDLGVVRDSTLNATNDYQTFVETFEGICVPGNEVGLLEGLEICPTGATGDRVTLTPCTPGPS